MGFDGAALLRPPPKLRPDARAKETGTAREGRPVRSSAYLTLAHRVRCLHAMPLHVTGHHSVLCRWLCMQRALAQACKEFSLWHYDPCADL